MDDAPAHARHASVLRDLLTSCPWMTAILEEVRYVADRFATTCWVGAGAVRDLAWDTWYGPSGPRDPAAFDGTTVSDVDVVLFDLADVAAPAAVGPGTARDVGTPTLEQVIEDMLRERRPDVRWDVTNQACVHQWYERRFGVAVDQLTSVADGVATWPETATAVAVAADGGTVEICAPLGLDDLLDGVWRHNPRRATSTEYRRRLERKRPAERWPGVRVVR